MNTAINRITNITRAVISMAEARHPMQPPVIILPTFRSRPEIDRNNKKVYAKIAISDKLSEQNVDEKS
jgi:hypothetical protein